MLRTLTEEESAEDERKMDEWWSSLDGVAKNNIFHSLKSILSNKSVHTAFKDRADKDMAEAVRIMEKQQKSFREQRERGQGKVSKLKKVGH